MKLSRYEQETIVNYNLNSPTNYNEGYIKVCNPLVNIAFYPAFLLHIPVIIVIIIITR